MFSGHFFSVLSYEISFTEMQSKYPLNSLICNPLSARQNACSTAMDMFNDLRDVFINLVCKSFRTFILKNRDLNESGKSFGRANKYTFLFWFK